MLPFNLHVIDTTDTKSIANEFLKVAQLKDACRLHPSPIHVSDNLFSPTMDEVVSAFKYIDLKVASRKDIFGMLMPATFDQAEKKNILEQATLVALDNPERDVFVVPYEQTSQKLFSELPFNKVRFASLHLDHLPDVQDISGAWVEANRIFHFPSTGNENLKRHVTIGGDETRYVEIVDLDTFFDVRSQIFPDRKHGIG